MSIQTVITQMIMIALLISMGLYAYKKKLISDSSTKNISALIVHFTNPCLLIYSMLSTQDRVNGRLLLLGFVSAILTYVLLVLMAELLPRILKIKESERYCYWMLCVFGNIGFIGIPLAEAVLGPESLVYVCFHNLIYSLLIYTMGEYKLKKAAGLIRVGEDKWETVRTALACFINVGTVSAILSLIFYIFNWTLPDILLSTCDYAGRATTFLSMVILGVAVAQMSITKVLRNHKLIIFSLIRLVIIPVIAVLSFKLFINDELIICSSALMLAVPAGNLPFILATHHRLEASTISDGIVLSTVLSLITIPIVSIFV